MNASRGIIIKSFFPEKGRIVLFDEAQGRCEAWLSERAIARTFSSLSSGLLLQYQVEQWHNRMVLREVEPIAYPQQGHVSLVFIHHLMELLLFFTPEEQPQKELFACILELYRVKTEESFCDTRFTQQLFLCKFFLLLGVYPDEESYKRAVHMRSLLLLPLDIMVKAADERDMAHMVHAWLLACIHTHPQGQSLKTVLCYSEQG